MPPWAAGRVSGMALTASLTTSSVGNQKGRFGTITFDASYPTGGEAITPATFGLTFLNHLVITDNAGADVVAWDRTNAKLVAYVRTTGVEVADTTDLSALVISVLALGG